MAVQIFEDPAVRRNERMKANIRIALLILTGCAGLVLVWGCAQNNDVVSPQIKTTVTLQPYLLPELDSVYVYELWMVKGDDYISPSAQFASLGKFTWDNTEFAFRSVSGDTIISNDFELPETWYEYDFIVVSVENRNDAAPGTPSGAYMLVDNVIDPKIRPIELKFPVSMFGALGFYFVGTPTNDTTYWSLAENRLVRVSELEEKGIWICSRSQSPFSLHDTLSLISVDTVMTVEYDSAAMGLPDTIGVVWPDEWAVETTQVVFGYDTLQHRRINVDWVAIVDSNYRYQVLTEYEIDSIPSPDYTPSSPDYPYPLGTLIPFYYVYSGPLQGLPDIKPYGWRYNAWVMLEQPDSTETHDNTGMNLSKMIPFGDGRQELFAGDNSWGVLPLGGFYRSDSADILNEYLDNREVPNFPGEDFIVGAERFKNLNLRRSSSVRWGTVVVGMEPDPAKVTIDPNVNFPLFFLSDDLPSTNEGPVGQVQLFHNWSSFMPAIRVTVKMKE